MPPKVTASFMIPPDLLKQMDDLADAQNQSRSKLLERWIREKVEEEKTTVAVLSNPLLLQAFAKAFGAPGMMREMAKAVGQEMSDQQLELFHRTLSQVGEQLAGPEPSAVAAVTSKKLPARTTKKRGNK